MQLAPVVRVPSPHKVLVAFITLRVCLVILIPNFLSLESFFSFCKQSLQKGMVQFNGNHYITLRLGTQQNTFLLCWLVQGWLWHRELEVASKVKGSKRNISSSSIPFQTVSLHPESIFNLIMPSHSDSIFFIEAKIVTRSNMSFPKVHRTVPYWGCSTAPAPAGAFFLRGVCLAH